MEEVLWIFKEAAIPLVLGLAMAASLSSRSQRSASEKRSTSIRYQALILFSFLLERFQLHSPLQNLAVQLRGGVSAAFGIGFAMSSIRLGNTWQDRISGAFLLTLFVAFVWLTFDSEIESALHHLVP